MTKDDEDRGMRTIFQTSQQLSVLVMGACPEGKVPTDLSGFPSSFLPIFDPSLIFQSLTPF